MKDVGGKVAVVTGGASGIGLAMAKRFAQAGMKVVLADIEAAPLADAEKAVLAAGAPGVRAVVTDVGKAADLEGLAAITYETFGCAHVLCNNAGVGGGAGPMWTIEPGDWAWTFAVNLWGVIHGIRSFVPRMLAQGGEAHIVNTASMAGLTATPFLGPYNAAKHAVVALSETLAKEFELTGAPIGVSVLCPGFVKTRIAESHRNRPADLAGTARTATGEKTGGVMEQLVSMGIPPETVADRVFEAILAPHFYVLTHPELKGAIATRMKEILEERQPSIDDFVRAAFVPPPAK